MLKVAQEPAVKLLLNGGKEEMDTATIPIRWFFSKEILEKKPEGGLFFEQDKRESENDNDAGRRGRRRACRVKDIETFMQFFSHGWHRLAVIVLGKTSTGTIEDFLEGRREVFSMALSWTRLAESKSSNLYSTLASAVVEFVVPEDLFAEKPRTKLGNWIWGLVNRRLYHDDPCDECEYRKRRMYAVPYFALLYPIGMFLKHMVGGVIYAFLVLLSSFWFFFWGWRPENILKGMRGAFLWRRSDGLETRMYPGNGYRVWVRGAKRIPIAPYQLCLAIVAIVVLIRTIYLYFNETLQVVTLGGGMMVAIALFYFVAKLLIVAFRPLGEKIKVEKARRKVLAAERLEKERNMTRKATQEWLAKTFSVSTMPREIDLKKLPQPLRPSDRIAHRFRVSFWAMKMKVCKPYSR